MGAIWVPRSVRRGRSGSGAEAERKRRRLAEKETQENSERGFHAYGKPMEAMSEFRYLRQLLKGAVAGNIQKVQVSWGRLARVLGREGADPKVSRIFTLR